MGVVVELGSSLFPLYCSLKPPSSSSVTHRRLERDPTTDASHAW